MTPDRIQKALQSEFPDADPSAGVWERVKTTLPARRRAPRWAMRLAAAAVTVMLLSLTGVGLARTETGQEMLDWVFKRFGIHLVEVTPELTQAWQEKGMETTSAKPIAPERITQAIPYGMKLPTYLPEAVKNGQTDLNRWTGGAGVGWFNNKGQGVTVEWHQTRFKEGSVTGTHGPARDIQQVKIGDAKALAFQDDQGWQVSWAMDGHQYTVYTAISLEEAIKVAESIK